MMSFIFRSPGAIVFGPNTYKDLGAHIKLLQGQRAFIITDQGVAKAGLLDMLLDVLKKDGIEVGAFDQVIPEPPIDTVEEIAEQVKAGGFDVIVGFGGGSSIDVAKVVSILVTNGGPAEQYVGIDMIPKKGLPTIMIPTTAGTGSEVTPNAIFSFPAEEVKKGIVSPKLIADVALVDPVFTYCLPPAITANTGMDALIHAMESYLAKKANKMTEEIALNAINLISQNLRTAVHCGDNVEARYNMALGSLMAGISFGNTGVGAVHALAMSMGGKVAIPHGLANSLMLCEVMKYNMVGQMEKFAIMAEALGENTTDLPLRKAAKKVIDALESLIADVGIPTRLRDVHVPKESLKEIAQGAINQTRLLSNNIRKFTLEDIEKIYKAVY